MCGINDGSTRCHQTDILISIPRARDREERRRVEKKMSAEVQRNGRGSKGEEKDGVNVDEREHFRALSAQSSLGRSLEISSAGLFPRPLFWSPGIGNQRDESLV